MSAIVKSFAKVGLKPEQRKIPAIAGIACSGVGFLLACMAASAGQASVDSVTMFPWGVMTYNYVVPTAGDLLNIGGAAAEVTKAAVADATAENVAAANDLLSAFTRRMSANEFEISLGLNHYADGWSAVGAQAVTEYPEGDCADVSGAVNGVAIFIAILATATLGLAVSRFQPAWEKSIAQKIAGVAIPLVMLIMGLAIFMVQNGSCYGDFLDTWEATMSATGGSNFEKKMGAGQIMFLVALIMNVFSGVCQTLIPFNMEEEPCKEAQPKAEEP